MGELIRLKHTTPQEAVARAKKEVEAEREGKQLGLITRFPDLNIAMRKYFRFNTVNLWSGLSGSGKSYFVGLLNEDFLDYKKGGINEHIDFIPIVLHFCFEMSSYNEVLRAIANDLGISYNYLLSSQYNKETKTYNRITDEEFIKIQVALNRYSNKSIIFYETAGNMIHIYNTVLHVYNNYKKSNKPHKLIVNIDHTLLIETIGKQEALTLMADVGKYSIKIRKDFGAMVNLVGQFNNNIEDTKRLTTPALHYPQKSDIYAQGQLFNACDSVFTWHQPSLLKIKEYGRTKRPSDGLMHLQVLKARHGSIGSVWFLNQLSKGKIIAYPTADSSAIDDENLKNI